MISLSKYYSACKLATGKNPNKDQKEALSAPADDALFIVAGPGTGKTACLTLRILKLILVDGISPNGILATTFTRKAAAGLRSRILGWGFSLIEALLADGDLSDKTKQGIESTDINQVVTGTLDSICEELLRDYRDPGTQPPILVDEFVSRTLMLREGLLTSGLYLDNELDALLFAMSAKTSAWGWNVASKTDLLMKLWDRRIHDQVDWKSFLEGDNPQQKKAREKLDRSLSIYENELKSRLMVDFAMLEQEVLDRLKRKGLSEFQEQLKVILVDEYQDTNLLQEFIYFELAKACGGALTVVGDDDQSLYRFRGPGGYDDH
jgi:DNA helicase II / ATP-dependent DNA helicase PcrA